MLYTGNGEIAGPINIIAFFQHVIAGHNIGPIPFVNGGITTALGVNQDAVVPIDINHNLTRAVGLITCACVIYVSTDPEANAVAVVQHINSGVLNLENIGQASAALGNPPANSIYVIYAHRNFTDGGYQGAINLLVNHAIPENHIIEIENLHFDFFGINNLGQIG